jgi:uncharacterized YigZ family protein
MTDSGSYLTIENQATAIFRDRGSKFIAYTFPVTGPEECKKRLAEIKKEHPKATHYCFAWRIGTDGNQFRVSDDGEPSGTAGRPILGQIDSHSLTGLIIVVVRYFGGMQLGIPGLINAYKTAASMVLANASIIKKPILRHFIFRFDYTRMTDLMQVIRRSGAVVLKQDMQLFCELLVDIPLNEVDKVLKRISELATVEIQEVL